MVIMYKYAVQQGFFLSANNYIAAPPQLEMILYEQNFSVFRSAAIV